MNPPPRSFEYLALGEVVILKRLVLDEFATLEDDASHDPNDASENNELSQALIALLTKLERLSSC